MPRKQQWSRRAGYVPPTSFPPLEKPFLCDYVRAKVGLSNILIQLDRAKKYYNKKNR